MIEFTTERIVFAIIAVVWTPAIWLLSRYYLMGQVSGWAEDLEAVKKRNDILTQELKEAEEKTNQERERASEIGQRLLDEKKKSLDLKHKVVDMIKANQDSFKAFDDYLEERGLK